MRHFTFELHDRVIHKEVRFNNRFGIEIAEDIYIPKNATAQSPALVCCGAFGAVKEQASGFYANAMAARGFITLAFDGSFTGESGGPQNVASTDVMTEDVMSAIDELGRQPEVDRERIGLIGICGWGSIALHAASLDKRVRAVATVSMFDLSFIGGVDEETRQNTLDELAVHRWRDVDAGRLQLGPHRFPQGPPEQGDSEEKDMYDYYLNRAFHENSIISGGAWTVTNQISLMHGGLLDFIKDISPRPILLIHGENARTKGNSIKAYENAREPKELMIIPQAGHCTLYDRTDKIPFDKLEGFFQEKMQLTPDRATLQIGD
ncbi:alpha/beta hydrolase [Corynebacterium sp. 22KM0430]|uniref:alpha/beta hydrolase n=1 Tax=Corynebacterium sp. 22KM0430 TaxID=2989735 RepID=UPI0029CA29A6|nr:alpha/beta hydrolase [Corynebacterium sp. 22KM0430]WPF66091.1 alpha/beta hydrolase [Corynebacterium sp. 22KM0430]